MLDAMYSMLDMKTRLEESSSGAGEELDGSSTTQAPSRMMEAPSIWYILELRPGSSTIKHKQTTAFDELCGSSKHSTSDLQHTQQSPGQQHGDGDQSLVQ